MKYSYLSRKYLIAFSFKIYLCSLVRGFEMIISFAILLSVVFGTVLSVDHRGSKSLTGAATKSLISEYFNNGNCISKIDIIEFGKSSTEAGNLIHDLLRSNITSISFQVSQNSGDRPWTHQLNVSTLLVFQTVKDFRQSRKNIKWLSGNQTRPRHLVVLPSGKIDDFEDIEDGFPIDNVSFLVNDNQNSIDLITSFMFSPYLCRQNRFEKINTFKRNTLKWENKVFYPKKYQNLHGCSVVIKSKTIQSSQIFSIFATMVELFNFTVETKPWTSHDQIVVFNIYLEDYSHARRNFTLSVPFAIESASFIIPPDEPYTPLEKILPFDEKTWIAVIATLLFCLVSIKVLNFMSPIVQNFVYGRNITTPTLNLVSIVLNGGQYKVPTRNFARFILMLLIMWSLVLRTCYQSEVFKYMQSDLRKPRIDSIDKLVEKNFSWLMATGSTGALELGDPVENGISFEFYY